ncbi:MAG TPA: hypothetical protein VLX64_05670, partial [Thermoplasmata archaeon]|nr:hypothetical protein [Thermoplasmata archaeon]
RSASAPRRPGSRGGSTRRRSGRARAAAAARARRRPPARPAPEDDIVAAARRLGASGRGAFDSQRAFLDALDRELGRAGARPAVGARRARRILLEAGAVRLAVVFAERAPGPGRSACPVCDGPLKPIRNRTLTGGTIAIGLACGRCGYWSHARKRTPVRYAVRLRPPPPTDRRSG